MSVTLTGVFLKLADTLLLYYHILASCITDHIKFILYPQHILGESNLTDDRNTVVEQFTSSPTLWAHWPHWSPPPPPPPPGS